MSRLFDTAGRLLTINNQRSALGFTYDAANQLLSGTQDLTALNSGLSPQIVNYSYDADGNRLTLTYPGGDLVNYGYTVSILPTPSGG